MRDGQLQINNNNNSSSHLPSSRCDSDTVLRMSCLVTQPVSDEATLSVNKRSSG